MNREIKVEPKIELKLVIRQNKDNMEVSVEVWLETASNLNTFTGDAKESRINKRITNLQLK